MMFILTEDIREKLIKCAQSTPYSYSDLVDTYLSTGWFPTDDCPSLDVYCAKIALARVRW